MKTKFLSGGFTARLPHSPLFWLPATLLLVCLEPATPAPVPDRFESARAFKARLQDSILPYWYDTAQDKERGGYLLADDVKGRGQAREKQLVTQSRMIWGFAHAARKGYKDPKRDYLQAAAQGVRFLQTHFRDREHGGYFWKTDLAGTVTNDRKILYGEAFVIYALVEYHRASGDADALREAMALYRTIQARAHDRKNPGWYEHFERDWRPILDPKANIEVEVAGYKSANTHLHLMEALAELAEVSRDAAVTKSLAEALELNQKYFYPVLAGESCYHRQPNWDRVTDPKSAGLSYGHNVEFAWLMLRAEAVLGRTPSWAHFENHLRHALEHGYDHTRGGLYSKGFGDQPATDTDKVWWVQSEMLAALTVAVQRRADEPDVKALGSLVDFIVRYQADRDGIWLDTVTAEGKPKSTAKAHNWKANYHDVRAIVMFVEAFAPPAKTVR